MPRLAAEVAGPFPVEAEAKAKAQLSIVLSLSLMTGTLPAPFAVFNENVLTTESESLIRHVILAALLAGAVACGPEEPPVMERGAFIEVMIRLRQAELDADTASFGSRRDEILTSAAVTDSMLIEFARVRGRDAAFMAAVWDSIDKVVNEVRDAEADLVPDTTGPS